MPELKPTEDTLMGALGIEIIEITPDEVVAEMPVHAATHQPFGLLHGGASVALAETAASVGTFNQIDPETEAAVGLEINANHLRSKADGKVTATAAPLHKGQSTMVWEIRITDEEDALICVSRCTVAIKKRTS
ncbi:uncharacterized protein (TIGR00369 family) [Salsuginibacillus halophilus]|uniref:Uncharacterized protein (TIGR00369 family) n=1 Tax=Salsuginibacillus halophilus TaxID=517424 RepID=A0A2P8HBG5_9BACI|nr:hotdog fold thioesterase [Salsuginibacillus halophilus]PSL43557.1 uncharacterized protein (TIGR00369 family) [Salsuginibacillus halophilus]